MADEADIQAVIDAVPGPIIALDSRLMVVCFNASARAFAPSLRRNEPLSLALRIPEVLEASRRAAATGQAQCSEFSERVPVDRWYEAQVTPVTVRMNVPGRGNIMLLSLHDLTPLRRADQMRADFVANASHELRTPLAALSGFIETLQGPARDDVAARERFLSIMRAQATRMARLIDDLLSLSRIELNAHLRPSTAVDLLSVVRQVTDGLEPLARDRDVVLAVRAPEKPISVPGDRDELVRLFENLIENALKYGASGKRVDITLASVDAPGLQEARVSVRDYGPGIGAEHLPRLTERFYRVDVTESRAQGGTGLGLSLVKHILNHHGGRLVIDSRPGEGAIFTARLPLATGT
jgi:two-component system phosphate regulon sensor histidine kinase PhoR